MQRRGFIGGCIAALAGLFGAKPSEAAVKDALKEKLSSLQLVFPGPGYPGLDEQMEEWRRKNPYTYTDADGTWHSRDCLRISRDKPYGAMEKCDFGDQQEGDWVLMIDHQHNYEKGIINQVVNVEAHIVKGWTKLSCSLPGVPLTEHPVMDAVNCDPIPIDMLAHRLDQNMDRKRPDPTRLDKAQYTISAGRIHRMAYMLRIGEETVDIDELRNYHAHTRILPLVEKLPGGPTTEECMFLAYFATGFPEWTQGALLRGLMAITEQHKVPQGIRQIYCGEHLDEKKLDDLVEFVGFGDHTDFGADRVIIHAPQSGLNQIRKFIPHDGCLMVHATKGRYIVHYDHRVPTDFLWMELAPRNNEYPYALWCWLVDRVKNYETIWKRSPQVVKLTVQQSQDIRTFLASQGIHNPDVVMGMMPMWDQPQFCLTERIYVQT